MQNASAAVWRNAVRAYVRRFPINRGKRYLMEALAPRYVTPDEEVCQLPGGASISADLREHVQRWIYFFGAYEQETVNWFRSVLRPGMTVLDIGAHVGQYTLIAAADVGSAGRVHAFEPNPGTFRRLSANISRNSFQHVRAHQVALSNTPGETTLFIPQHDNAGESSLQSCVEDSTSTKIRSITADEWAPTADLGTRPRVDVIKLDVQGFETRVIEGASGLIARFRPTVVCEFEERWLRLAGSSSVDLKRTFSDLGYTINRINGNKLTPVAPDEPHDFENLVLTPKAGIRHSAA